MTDNEIIKALKCWAQLDGCKNCPFIEQGCFDCEAIPIDVAKSIVDLINRQKAEIEELRELSSKRFDNFATEYDRKIQAEALQQALTEKLLVTNHSEKLYVCYKDFVDGEFYPFGNGGLDRELVHKVLQRYEELLENSEN